MCNKQQGKGNEKRGRVDDRTAREPVEGQANDLDESAEQVERGDRDDGEHGKRGRDGHTHANKERAHHETSRRAAQVSTDHVAQAARRCEQQQLFARWRLSESHRVHERNCAQLRHEHVYLTEFQPPKEQSRSDLFATFKCLYSTFFKKIFSFN